MKPRTLGPGVFLLLHDPFTGRPAVGRRVMTCGVVSAEIAELVIAGDLDVVADGVVARVGQAAVGSRDDVSDFVFEAVRRERVVKDLRYWVGTVGEMVFELNARQLVERGIVARVQRRGVLRRGVEVFPAEDLLAASHLSVRLRHLLTHPRQLDLPNAFSIVLLHGLGAVSVLQEDMQEDIDPSFYQTLRGHLPTNLGTLMDHLDEALTAVGFAVR